MDDLELSKKYLVWSKWDMVSSAATNYALVLLLVLSFCFDEMAWMVPLRKVMVALVWLFML